MSEQPPRDGGPLNAVAAVRPEDPSLRSDGVQLDEANDAVKRTAAGDRTTEGEDDLASHASATKPWESPEVLLFLAPVGVRDMRRFCPGVVPSGRPRVASPS